eukprot:COSAG02_NODE_63153_length_264_cov_0.606061_1_plen_35_part_01
MYVQYGTDPEGCWVRIQNSTLRGVKTPPISLIMRN